MSWLTESNREEHFIWGMVLYVASFIANGVMVGNGFIAGIVSFEIVFTVACAMEFKDRLWGGKFDWLDILATIAFALVALLIDVMLYVFNLLA